MNGTSRRSLMVVTEVRHSAPVKVLILTAGFGDGHNAAARNVREALEAVEPESCRVEVLDLLEAVYGRVNQLVKSAYLGMVRHAPGLWRTFYNLFDAGSPLGDVGSWVRLRRALGDILAETEPDVVISTYPVYADVLAELFRDHAERPFRFYTVITDSFSVNAAWLRSPSDGYFFANDMTAEALCERGVRRDLVHVSGFPVSPAFLEENDEEPLEPPGDDEPVRILYVANHGRSSVGRGLERLLEVPGLRVTVTVGRDGELKAELQDRLAEYAHRVRILGWTNVMPRLLRTHHLIIGKAGGATVQEAIAAGCPMIINQVIPGQEEGNARLVVERGFGCSVDGNKEVVSAVKSALADGARLWRQWRANLGREGRADGAFRIAEFVLNEDGDRVLKLSDGVLKPVRWNGNGRSEVGPAVVPSEKERPLLCDFHTHTNYSDGKLTVTELVDFYGAHGFDCICITDHLADPRRLIGKLSRLSGLTLSPLQLEEYFEVIRREANRAWRRYRMLVMAGIEFNKDGCRAKTSAHLLGIDLRRPIAPDMDLPATIAEIHAQGGLAVASHPHVMKSEWGKNTLYLWENQETFAPLLDAWEIANRENLFSPVALKRLPFLANSDFHKPKHIYSWKTVLQCVKDPEAIKECIRKNEKVSITLYRKPAMRTSELRPEVTGPMGVLDEKSWNLPGIEESGPAGSLVRREFPAPHEQVCRR